MANMLALTFFFFNDTATTEIYTFPTRRSSDLGLNGVVSGAVLAAGRFGQGYSFDGADDQVTVARNVIQEPANITVAAWIYPLAGYGEVAPKIVSKLALVPLKGYDFFITPATGILSWSLVL